MSKVDDLVKSGIFNGEATLRVKHLFAVSGIFVVIILAGVAFGLWFVKTDIKEAVAPLQTKSDATSSEKERKKEWNDWRDKEWNPHIKESAQSNVSIGILLDRTDSKATNTNSLGRSGIVATPPPR